VAAAAAATLCTAEASASSVTSDMPPPPTGDAASNTSEVPWPLLALTSSCVSQHWKAAQACSLRRHEHVVSALQGTHLVPLKEKQRLYFLYEKRIRELSNSEKVYEYFANEKRSDGSAFMRPQVWDGVMVMYPDCCGQALLRLVYLQHCCS
jgi:hypothetical protein